MEPQITAQPESCHQAHPRRHNLEDESRQIALTAGTTRQDSQDFSEHLQQVLQQLREKAKDATPFEHQTGKRSTGRRAGNDESAIGYRIVSSPTGSGKTLGAIALMSFLYRSRQPSSQDDQGGWKPCSKRFGESFHRTSGDYTSVHKPRAKPKDIARRLS